MHGDNNSWFRDQRARDVLDRNIFSGEAVEMVVVSPNAGGGDPAVYQNGYFNMPGWAYEDFFFNELMPYVEKRYRAGGSKKMRAVAGLSMGGGGTTGYAQHHPDKFCAAYAMSALMDIPKYGAVPSKSPDDKIARLTKSVQDNSCVRHVAEADETQREALRSVRWFVDCGDDDFLLDRNIDFVRPCTAPASLCSSACAKADTTRNTGTVHCTSACPSCLGHSHDRQAHSAARHSSRAAEMASRSMSRPMNTSFTMRSP